MNVDNKAYIYLLIISTTQWHIKASLLSANGGGGGLM